MTEGIGNIVGGKTADEVAVEDTVENITPAETPIPEQAIERIPTLPAAEEIAPPTKTPEPVARKEKPAEKPVENPQEKPKKKGFSLFTKRKLDDQMLEELEELLIAADLGVTAAAEVTAALAKGRFDKEITSDEVKHAMAGKIAEILKPVAKPIQITKAKPHVILVVGVNGNGKTTTIGKLAEHYRGEGHSVMLAACDTFRAAAVEQLTIWGERTKCEVIKGPAQSDPASVAFKALEVAETKGVDILLMDTAGRLQNKEGLMEELAKIVRVLKKKNAAVPHDTVLVLDATTGQNAHSQVEIFKEKVSITGLIVTKLDGTAKGGVVVALARKFGIPIHAVGVGEKAEDLKPFKPEEFAQGLVGL
ncbi:MAG: signal recognition particle-docking protein FtsY [Proteobacteria bacterium]|nr:signal recognition particle-docking protein FtsY [Pseudomonadota bacterium]